MLFSSKDEALRVLGSAGYVGLGLLAERLVYQSGAGVPSGGIKFVGERYLDTSNNNFYTAVNTTTWKQDSN